MAYMNKSDKSLRLLAVSAAERTCESVLSACSDLPITGVGAKSAGEARRAVSETRPDIVLIRPPLPDETGIELAQDLAAAGSGVMLILPAERCEQLYLRAIQLGIVLLPRPTDKQLLRQAIGLLAAAAVRARMLSARTQSLEDKIGELSAVSRAKLLLIEHEHMTEDEAHHYIERIAMDKCIKRRAAADIIVHTYNKGNGADG